MKKAHQQRLKPIPCIGCGEATVRRVHKKPICLPCNLWFEGVEMGREYGEKSLNAVFEKGFIYGASLGENQIPIKTISPKSKEKKK